MAASSVEPALGLLADSGRRRLLIVGGGVVFALSLALTSVATSIAALLIAFAFLYPASGAFVSLSQTMLMDLDPARREANMARWVLAGSIGVVAGPIALTLALATGHGWRAIFAVFAAIALPLVVFAGRTPDDKRSPVSLMAGLRATLAALRSWRVVRWLALLEAGDAMGDLLTGYVALYIIDVAGARPVQAGLAVIVLTVAGLVGDTLLLPLLARTSGTAYLRWSALAVLAIYPAFLLAPGLVLKLAPLALLGVIRAGWYAIPQAGLYNEVPEASGSVLVLTNAGGLVASAIPLVFGFTAERIGFGPAMWLLLLGPVVVLALARELSR